MIEPVYVPYEQYRAAKTRCGLDSRIYGNFFTMKCLELRQHLPTYTNISNPVHIISEKLMFVHL
jgi:hypothetical protein